MGKISMAWHRQTFIWFGELGWNQLFGASCAPWHTVALILSGDFQYHWNTNEDQGHVRVACKASMAWGAILFAEIFRLQMLSWTCTSMSLHTWDAYEATVNTVGRFTSHPIREQDRDDVTLLTNHITEKGEFYLANPGDHSHRQQSASDWEAQIDSH